MDRIGVHVEDRSRRARHSTPPSACLHASSVVPSRTIAVGLEEGAGAGLRGLRRCPRHVRGQSMARRRAIWRFAASPAGGSTSAAGLPPAFSRRCGRPHSRMDSATRSRVGRSFRRSPSGWSWTTVPRSGGGASRLVVARLAGAKGQPPRLPKTIAMLTSSTYLPSLNRTRSRKRPSSTKPKARYRATAGRFSALTRSSILWTAGLARAQSSSASPLCQHGAAVTLAPVANLDTHVQAQYVRDIAQAHRP